jgi:hypothetical protein
MYSFGKVYFTVTFGVTSADQPWKIGSILFWSMLVGATTIESMFGVDKTRRCIILKFSMRSLLSSTKFDHNRESGFAVLSNLASIHISVIIGN